MRGRRFESEGDEPIFVVLMGDGYAMISQANGAGQVESVGTDVERLRAMADYIEAKSKNTDRGCGKAA